MTDNWWNDLYNQAGNDIFDATISRMITEFAYLDEKKVSATLSAISPAVRDEAPPVN